MIDNIAATRWLVLLVASLATAVAKAEITIETVAVGNQKNQGEQSGAPYGDYHYYGAVPYGYTMGKFEVTAGQYTEFLNAVAKTDTYDLYSSEMSYGYAGFGCRIQRSGPSGDYTYTVAAEWADRPVNFVSWGDAARFANWMENGQPTGAQDLTTTESGSYYLNGATSSAALMAVTRQPGAIWVIPTEDEWYKAAYHKNDGITANYWDYPTGTNATPSNVLSDPSPDPGNNATFKDTSYTDPTHFRTEVGAHENSASPYGTYDQGGNVWEWNEMRVDGTVLGTIVRGGSFYGWDSYMQVSYRPGWFSSPTDESGNLGFRLAKMPEPASALLLLWGTIGLLSFRRR